MAQPIHMSKVFAALYAAMLGSPATPLKPRNVRQFIRWEPDGEWEEWPGKFYLDPEELREGESLLEWEVQS